MCSVISCAAVSSFNAARACGSAIPARLAAAKLVKSGPGCRPSWANRAAAGDDRPSTDQENTARTLASTSAVSRPSSRCWASLSSVASVARASPGRAVARAAVMASASGSPAHSLISCAVAAGSAASLSAPSRPASRSRASAWGRRPSLIGQAPSIVTSPASWRRLVTTTRQPGPPGSSGRIWSASRTLSSSTSIRLPANRLRYKPAWASCPAGICPAGRPRASSMPRIASAAFTGRLEGSNPRRLTYSWPSGNRLATWCAQCTAMAVLPIPAIPPIVMISTGPGGAPASPSSPVSRSSSARRPAKCRTGAGSCRGTSAGGAAVPAGRPFDRHCGALAREGNA